MVLVKVSEAAVGIGPVNCHTMHVPSAESESRQNLCTAPIIGQVHVWNGFWCRRRDSNPHTLRALRPERSASTVPATSALAPAARLEWAVEDLNLGPLACEASALTTELTALDTRRARQTPVGGEHTSSCSLRPGLPIPRRRLASGNDRVRTCDLALMKRPLYL